MELKVVCENASELSRTDQEAFAMIRRQGFGASDSSIILGVNPFPDGTINKLLKQKISPYITAEELAIGQMVNVRKGADLEPLILQKFTKMFNIDLEDIKKPDAMYRIGDTPLTVNFDGILDYANNKLAVECKFVSLYGSKYYDLTKSVEEGSYFPADLLKIRDIKDLGSEVNSIYLTERAKECGIPIYYYTQIQQQLLALDAPWGYLAALFDKDWTLRVFTVMADEQVQNKLMEVANKLWTSLQGKN